MSAVNGGFGAICQKGERPVLAESARNGTTQTDPNPLLRLASVRLDESPAHLSTVSYR
jgi:hypothetical protein